MEKNSKVVLFLSPGQILTQDLRFSLRVLEMSNSEINELIEQEASENPFLRYERKQDYLSMSDIDQISHNHDFRQAILSQLSFYSLSEEEKTVAESLIYNITDSGYLDNDVLSKLRENYSYKVCISAINHLKETDYGHYFSFNLHDKIKNILQRLGSYTRAHEQMLLGAIKDGKIGNYKHENYQRVKNDIKNALRFMQMMSISETPNNPVDLIAKFHNESIDIEIEDNISEINIDIDLQNEMKTKSKSTADEKYISEKIKSAKLLLKSVNYRNNTLTRVAKEILYRQSEFFNSASAELSPLSVATIAGSLGIHESTVHRAIVNKTIATHRGNFELKQLLAKEIQLADSSGAVSDFSVKQYIKQLIRQEPPDSPYSDSNLVYFLSTRGIVISRRTVAKYRESMNLPNYIQRLKNHKITEYK